MKIPKRSRTIGTPTADKASAGADDAGAVNRAEPTRKADPASPTLDGGAEIARPSRALGGVVTLSPTEAAELLGLGRTKTYHLLKPLGRVEWSTAKRPRYRRDDVLGLISPQGNTAVPSEPVAGAVDNAFAFDAGRDAEPIPVPPFRQYTTEELDVIRQWADLPKDRQKD